MANQNDDDKVSLLPISDASNRQLCHNTGWVFIIGALLALGYYLFTPSDKASSKPEEVTVNLGHWTTITTDPEKERLKLNPAEGDLIEWQLVADKDFEHPHISTRSKPLDSLPGNMHTVHITLLSSKGPKQATFILERIPK